MVLYKTLKTDDIILNLLIKKEKIKNGLFVLKKENWKKPKQNEQNIIDRLIIRAKGVKQCQFMIKEQIIIIKAYTA